MSLRSPLAAVHEEHGQPWSFHYGHLCQGRDGLFRLFLDNGLGFLLLALAAAGTGLGGQTLTVRNETSRTLAVRQRHAPEGLQPWPPHPGFQRWLAPWTQATFFLPAPGQSFAAELVIRHLAADQALRIQGLAIQAVDPDLSPPPAPGRGPIPIGDEPPPDPEGCP